MDVAVSIDSAIQELIEAGIAKFWSSEFEHISFRVKKSRISKFITAWYEEM